MAELTYRPRPEAKATSKSVRRVYVLETALVARIHAYAHAEQHASEASAVRALLDQALKERGI